MIVEEGLKAILRFLLRNEIIDAKIGLFTNALTPIDSTVLADLTEATFPGYAQIPTRDLTWPDPTINGDDAAETDGPTITFTADDDPGSPEDVHGLFVTIQDDEDEPMLFLCAAFADAVTITEAGDQVQKKINWFCDDY